MAGATVAVCLAVHRPDPEPLRRQLASLQAQPRPDLPYVDRPLVDYVQHGANLVGHAPRRPAPGTPRATEPWRARARRDRERHVVRPQVMARALLERAGDRMAPAKRRAAERAARGDERLIDVARIVARGAAEQVRPRRTLDAHRRAARGALGRR